jgi:hypothetical protein
VWNKPERVLLAVLLGLAGTTAQAGMTCCNDANGRKVCGDGLPAACQGRPYRILDSAGFVIKDVNAPLTGEQRAQKEAEDRQRREEEVQQKERRRRDQALLETYSSVQDIERMRERNRADLQQAITQAENKIAELSKRRKKLENEAEFYKNKPLPEDIARGIKDVNAEIAGQNELINSRRKEIEQMQLRYDADRKRFVELTGQGDAPAGKPARP